MKRLLRNRKSRTKFVALLLTLAALAVYGQSNYTVDWFTIDGGGGTSTGGVYRVSGTIGQPDAGATMSGGNYSIDGGFLSAIATVPTPGAPLLVITVTATNTVVLSWPSPSTGFVLQEISDIAAADWSDSGLAPSDNGTAKIVVVPVGAGNKFYRLREP